MDYSVSLGKLSAYMKIASIIFAAGKGSRMKGLERNKTLLPLIPGRSAFEGSHPILLNIINNLPPGPKALVINYQKEEVIKATSSYGLTYIEQPLLNGTGGALLSSSEFIRGLDQDHMIITLGDVPLVRATSFLKLVDELNENQLVVLGFRPRDKKQYGMLELDGNHVKRIIEWKYWKEDEDDEEPGSGICNAGIFAVRKVDLLRFLPKLKNKPHTVLKERDGNMVKVEEFFITDLVELIYEDNQNVGYVIAKDEMEVMGVDDPPSLIKAQQLFRVGNP